MCGGKSRASQMDAQGAANLKADVDFREKSGRGQARARESEVKGHRAMIEKGRGAKRHRLGHT